MPIIRLVGLPGRSDFLAKIAAASGYYHAEGLGYGILLLNIDWFQSINAMYGYASSDSILQQTGRRLIQLASEDIFVAHLGADVFGMIISGVEALDALTAFASKVNNLFEAPFHVDSAAANISCSMGIATTLSSDPMANVFECAEYALAHRKHNLAVESNILSTDKVIEEAIVRADFDAEFSVVFQPIVDILKNKTIAFEALARWDSPSIGRVGPDLFFRGAERLRLTGKLTPVILKKAFTFASKWPDHISLSLNLSACDLTDPLTMHAVRQMVVESGINAGRIEFEITETAAIRSISAAAEEVSLLHKIGCRVALDDFGTSFSNFDYLRVIKPDCIKIDRTFVTGIEGSEVLQSIVGSVLALCKELNINCIVEGVEDASQLNILKEIGGRFVQGYLFSKPMVARDVAKYLRKEGIYPLSKPVNPSQAEQLFCSYIS